MVTELCNGLQTLLFIAALPAVVVAWVPPARVSPALRRTALLVLKALVVIAGVHFLGATLYALYVALTGTYATWGYSMMIMMVAVWDLPWIAFLVWIIRRAER